MGAWCDTFGRKLLIKIYLVSKLFTKTALILNAYFMNVSKYWIFLVFVPNGIAGKNFLKSQKSYVPFQAPHLKFFQIDSNEVIQQFSVTT